MQQRDIVVALLFAVVVETGCYPSVETPTSPPVSQTSIQPTTEQPVLQESEPDIASPEGQDVLQRFAAMNSKGSQHESEFRSGQVTLITTSTVEVHKNESGFTIQLPSRSPIPTQTVFQGRLYVSGGFSSQEYYFASHDLSTIEPRYVASRRLAPYLDQAVQRAASYSVDAAGFETSNGIGGGFGGGFGGGGGVGGGGVFAVADELADLPLPANADEQDPPHLGIPEEPANSSDPLVRTELQAADNIGLGNVSTLQSFQGSRVLYWNGRVYSSMGDVIVCTSAKSGEQVWTKQVDGDLRQVGGHLASPPVAAGGFLFVATVEGAILQLEPESGEVASTHQIDAELRFPPVIHEGRIYVGTQDGRIVCIDTGDESLSGWPMWGGDAGRRNVVFSE